MDKFYLTYRPLVLRSNVDVVFGPRRLNVIEIVDPKVHR